MIEIRGSERFCRLKMAAIGLLILLVLRLLTRSDQSVIQMSMSHGEEKWQFPKLRGGHFAFASYYSNHMVLQRAPKRAVIWGYSSNIGERITVKVSDRDSYTTTVYDDPSHNYGVWKIKLKPESSPGPFTIIAMSSEQTIELNDVMFGDVWLCSGQSNMVFQIGQVFNASEEIADADNYPDVRLFTVDNIVSSKPIPDLQGIMENWSRANSTTIHSVTEDYFSAVCWFYGKSLYKELGYPIGLITTAWGGTQVETWSSPDALAQCGLSDTKEGSLDFKRKAYIDAHLQKNIIDVPTTPSCLWNGMVHPFLNMTIYGAIWYQGEANTVPNVHKYNCTFPSMIDDWRRKFHDGSDGETDPMFPFGFVQLGPYRPDSHLPGYPEVRWHQTADYGYVPNPRMQNVFMSVALDMADFASPWGSVHYRDKQDVAARLTLSGLSVAYKRPGIQFQGPLPTHIEEGTNNISLLYTSKLRYNNMVGFEALCTVNANMSFWTEIPMLQPLLSQKITLWSGVCGQGQTIIGLRYLWRESPCAFKTCTVYSANNPLLPGPPFIVYKEMTKVKGTVHRLDWDSPVPIAA